MNTVFSQKRGRLVGTFVSLAIVCFFASSLLVAPRTASAAGVPVSDSLNTAQTTVTAAKSAASLLVQGKSLAESVLQTAKTYANHFKEWVGDGLVKYIAQTTLRGITQSVVNWINNDFRGSPSFVTNPEGFLSNLANKVIGKTISEIDPLWCEPFRLQMNTAFGVGYGFKGAEEELGCKLTDVIANVQGAYDSFVGGNFTQGGWKSWISITGNQQSNGYGAYLNTVNKIDASIITAGGREIKLLDWGQGFRSWRKCEIPGPEVIATDRHGANILDPDDPYKYVMKPGPCEKEGPIETPGSIIQDNLKQALGSDLMGLNFADEINEIIAALANKMVQKVMTSGLGGSTDYVEANYATGTTITPGYCDPADQPNSPLNPNNPLKYDKRLIQSEASYNKALANARIVRCQRSSHSFSVNLNADALFNPGARAGQDALLAVAGGGTPTDSTARATAAVDAATVQGQTTANNAAAGANVAGAGAGGSFGGNASPDVSSSNSGGKPKTTRQSSIKSHSVSVGGIIRDDGLSLYGSDKGIDGNTNGDGNATAKSYVETANEENPWWEIDLGQEFTVKEVHIWRRTDATFSPDKYLKDTYIFVTNTPYVRGSGPLNVADGVNIPIPGLGENEPTPLPVEVNKTGRYVRIQRAVIGRSILSFAEVKVLQSTVQGERKSTPQASNLAIDYAGSVSGSPRTTSQSSDQILGPDYNSRKGNDGNRDGNNGGDSPSIVRITNTDYPWWEVDLGSVQNIGQLKIWRRTDGPAGEFLSNVYAFVSDESCARPGRDLPACWEAGVKITDIDKSPEPRPLIVNMNEPGRYIRIQRNTKNYELSFSEIEIFEDSAGSGSRPPVPEITVTPEIVRFRQNGNNGSSGHNRVITVGGQSPSFVVTNTSGGNKNVQLTIQMAGRLPLGDLLDEFNVSLTDAETGGALPGLPLGAKCDKFPGSSCNIKNPPTRFSSQPGVTSIPVSFTLQQGKSARVTYEIIAMQTSRQHCTGHSRGLYSVCLVNPASKNSIDTQISAGGFSTTHQLKFD